MSKGFTLIELLIVIGIIAILATAVLLVLNPGQILAETRDTQRLSDLDTLKAAINLAAFNDANITYPDAAGCSITVTIAQSPFGVACTAPAAAALRAVDGTGWMTVDLGSSPSVSVLPVDPTQTTTYSYHYNGNGAVNGTYELDTRLESTKHRTKMENDGGDDNTCTGDYVDATCWYEVGTSLTQT